MRLSISNLAWDVSEDEEIAGLLRRFAVDAIDVAPGKYFPAPAEATPDDTTRVKRWWAERGIEIVGMQSLLFGTTGLNLFGSPDVQDAMLDHLAAVCRIGAAVGGTRLVFGSPKNRDRTGLNEHEALEIAVPFFKRLGDIAAQHGVLVCLEPNPTRYGANFMTTSAETLRVVKQVGHAAIKMQLDSGAIAINGEDPLTTVRVCASGIGHVHASEPDLVPLGEGTSDHELVAHGLRQYLPSHVVTIEMVATSKESHYASIERALNVANRCYRDLKAGANG